MDERRKTRQNEQSKQGRKAQTNRAIRTNGAKRSVPAQAAQAAKKSLPRGSGKRKPPRRKIIWRILGVLFLIAAALMLIFALGSHFSQPKDEQVWEMTQQGAVVFSDGQTVDRWRIHQGSLSGNASYYKLSDGTVLLVENDMELQFSSEPAFTALSDTAQQAITSYYSSRGKLYDLTKLLQQAYALYQSAPESYTPGIVEQVVSLSASNQRILCCLTDVTLALDTDQTQQLRYGEVFRCETGEAVDLWSMFNVSESQARSSLVSPADPALQSALAELLEPEWVVFCPENIEINIPAGTFALQENAYQLGIRYEDLAGLLYTWAIPDSTQ